MLIGHVFQYGENGWLVDTNQLIHKGSTIIFRAYNYENRKQAALKLIPKQLLLKSKLNSAQFVSFLKQNQKNSSALKILEVSEERDCVFALVEYETLTIDSIMKKCLLPDSKTTLILLQKFLECLLQIASNRVQLGIDLKNFYLTKEGEKVVADLSQVQIVGRRSNQFQSEVKQAVKTIWADQSGIHKQTYESVLKILDDETVNILMTLEKAVYTINKSTQPRSPRKTNLGSNSKEGIKKLLDIKLKKQPSVPQLDQPLKPNIEITRPQVESELLAFNSVQLSPATDHELSSQLLTKQSLANIFLEILFSICLHTVKKKLAKKTQPQKSSQNTSKSTIRITTRPKISAEMISEIKRVVKINFPEIDQTNDDALRLAAVKLGRKWYEKFFKRIAKRRLGEGYALLQEYDKQ